MTDAPSSPVVAAFPYAVLDATKECTVYLMPNAARPESGALTLEPGWMATPAGIGGRCSSGDVFFPWRHVVEVRGAL